jgi:hypothetical protein
MGIILADGFDFYAVSADMVAFGPWDASNATVSSTTRFGVGRSILMWNSMGLTKQNFPLNETTLFFAVAVKIGSVTGAASDGICFTFQDAANAQVTVEFALDGNIYVRAGGTSGSILATWASGVATTAWNQWNFKIVINNTTGSVECRQNGASSNTFAVTGINTRNGSTNAYVNRLVVFGAGGSGYNYMDDLLLYGTASGTDPQNWVGDIRAIQLLPNADTAQKDFTAVPASDTAVLSGSVITDAKLANYEYFSPAWTATKDGYVTKLTINLQAGFTGHLIAAVFDATGPLAPGPGAILATATAITNPTTGLNDLVFSTPAHVNAGTNYHFCFLADAAFSAFGSSAASNWLTKNPITYPTFAANPASMTISNDKTINSNVTFSLDNHSNVNDAAANDADTSFVYGGGVGNVDLYDLQDLNMTPLSIIGVNARMVARKSDTAARSAQIEISSGGTTDVSPAVAMTSSYGFYNRFWIADPNTAAAWTATAINALKIGPKVQA